MIQYSDNKRNIRYPEIQTAYPVYNKPSPQQNDYDTGYIYRYFVKKINDNVIYEISKENYTDVSPNIYAKVSIEWKLTGKKYDVFQNKIKIYDGVYDHNIAQIHKYKKYIIGLDKILRDPLEFWRPS